MTVITCGTTKVRYTRGEARVKERGAMNARLGASGHCQQVR